jgi:hypothetical protein
MKSQFGILFIEALKIKNFQNLHDLALPLLLVISAVNVATATQRSEVTDKHLKNSITYTISVSRDSRPRQNATFHPECSPNQGKTFSTSITFYLCRSPAEHDRGRKDADIPCFP